MYRGRKVFCHVLYVAAKGESLLKGLSNEMDIFAKVIRRLSVNFTVKMGLKRVYQCTFTLIIQDFLLKTSKLSTLTIQQ